MERTVIKILLIVVYYLLSNYDSIGQNTNALNKEVLFAFKSKNKTDPFYYKGKQHLENKVHCYIILENDLVKNVPIPDDVYCKNNIGIFAYRVNSQGKIDQVEYSGDLDPMIVQKIKYNIAQTQGLYTLPSSKSENIIHWFLLPFFSDGTQWNFYECEGEERLKSEFQAKFKQHRIYLSFLKLLPQFSDMTILHDMDHLPELISEGRVKY